MLPLKRAAYNLLCNNVTGALLLKLFPRIPDMRWRGYRFFVNPERSSKKIISSIFFGFYESSEIRLLHRFYDGQSNVVELGGSMGIVSGHIASLMKHGRKLVTVEPNPYLAATIRRNIEQYKKDNYSIVQAAIAYGVNEVDMEISMNNTASKMSASGAGAQGAVKIPAATLSGIVQSNNLDSYTLVCDIEGGEAGILLNDAAALQRCTQLFIELHDTHANGRDVSVQDLVQLLKGCGFECKYHEGPVYYFTR